MEHASHDEMWSARDEMPPFRSDNRRGYAGVTPVALSSVGVPNSPIKALDEYPTYGLGICDDYESCDRYTGYVWSTWTTKEAQPAHVDPALQAMIDQSVQMRSGPVGPNYHLDPPASSCALDGSKGSIETMSATQTPFPSTEDVTMEPTADRRSRESPDSTLKPEGKSLKTSEVATATATTATSACAVDDGVPDTSNPRAPTIRWKPKTIPEARSLMWEVHQRMAAWKSDKLIESVKTEHVDLAALAEATGSKPQR